MLSRLALFLSVVTLLHGQLDVFFPPKELCDILPTSLRYYEETNKTVRNSFDCYYRDSCYDPDTNRCFKLKGPVACELIAEPLRADCGQSGISERACNSRGCCYKRTETSGVPWCYLTKPNIVTSTDVCHLVPPNYRQQCGEPTEEETECEPQCCFIKRSDTVPSCFLPNPHPDPTDVCGSYIPSNMRVDCGYQGISRGRCLTRNCCYSVFQDTPWCFRKYPRHSTLDVCSPRSVPIHRRVNCGRGGIGRLACEARNCCFDNTSRDVPWCFHKTPRRP